MKNNYCKKGNLNPNYKNGLPKCLDCGKQLATYTAKRCRDCSSNYISKNFSGKNSKNFKGGPKKSICLDCGKKIRSRSKRCLSCLIKYKIGKNHPCYKGGLPKCIDCGKMLVTYSSKRCRSCFVINSYKGGRKMSNCIDCGKKIWPYSERCHSCCNKRKIVSEDQKEKISATRIKRGIGVKEKNPHWMGGKPKCYDCGKQLTNYNTKRCLPCQHKQLVRLNIAYKKNKCEIFLEDLLNKLLPKEYKYTGQADFWIENFNPDFINVNGQKKIIELFGDYWHKKPNYILRDRRKIKVYKKYGYDSLIIWQRDLKKEKTINRILEFNKK